jgi:hypothetical protein
MFCTLQEAAETLHASEDQVQALLERGLLHEFREGPYRLVKASDVGALARLRRRRAQTRRPPRLDRPEPQARQASRHATSGAHGARSRPHARPARAAPRPAASRTSPGDFDSRTSESGSVRQWFWMGLLQDRPITLAVLGGLLLLLLSALAAGLCLWAERF